MATDTTDAQYRSSAAPRNVDAMVERVFKDRARELVFRWNQTKCDKGDLGLVTQVVSHQRDVKPKGKPTFTKLLSRVHLEFPDYKRVLLVDDSEYKAVFNAKGSGFHPPSWSPDQADDDGLAPGGFVRGFLESLLSRTSETT